MYYFYNRNHPSGRILLSPLLQIKKNNISESWGYSSKTLWPMSKQKVWKPYPSHPSVWAISTPLCWVQTKSTTQNRYLFSVSSSYPDAPQVWSSPWCKLSSPSPALAFTTPSTIATLLLFTWFFEYLFFPLNCQVFASFRAVFGTQ